jgi:hypothetical protein
MGGPPLRFIARAGRLQREDGEPVCPLGPTTNRGRARSRRGSLSEAVITDEARRPAAGPHPGVPMRAYRKYDDCCHDRVRELERVKRLVLDLHDPQCRRALSSYAREIEYRLDGAPKASGRAGITSPEFKPDRARLGHQEPLQNS